jgi:hypothetical protein
LGDVARAISDMANTPLSKISAISMAISKSSVSHIQAVGCWNFTFAVAVALGPVGPRFGSAPR